MACIKARSASGQGNGRVILKKRWMFLDRSDPIHMLFGFLAYLRLTKHPMSLAYARMNADSLMSTIANEALREGLSEYRVTAEESGTLLL